MSRTVGPTSARAKSAQGVNRSEPFPKGNQNFPSGNRISPVAQKLRSLLPASKAAFELADLTDQPLSICQKLLSGHRRENIGMLRALLRHGDRDFAAEILRAFIGDDAPLSGDVAALRDLRRADEEARQAEIDAEVKRTRAQQLKARLT